jgi:hypothetical protein
LVIEPLYTKEFNPNQSIHNTLGIYLDMLPKHYLSILLLVKISHF